MKELKQTNKIFFAGMVFFTLILLGILTTKKPRLPYQITAKEAIALIADTTKLISLKNLNNNSSYTWIDVRNQFQYANGHIEDATNIYAPDLFEPFSIRYLKQLKKDKKKIILYGKDIHEASSPWMILAQLGFNNVYYLKEGFEGYQLLQAQKSLTSLQEPEQPALDYAKFFIEARKKMNNPTSTKSVHNRK